MIRRHMPRPGVGAERIVEAINELEAQAKEVTVTAVRERLGTGSFSTIGAVVSDWRQQRAKETRAPVPEPPEGMRGWVSQLWTEAWNGAMKVHEPERQAFARDREEFERGKAEMLSEIARLEAQLDQEKEQTAKAVAVLTAERDRYRADLDQVRGSLAEAQGVLGEARKRIEEEEGRNRELTERFLAEQGKAQAESAQLKAHLLSLTSQLDVEKDRAARTEKTLTAERDRLRQELAAAQTSLGAAEGALGEARKRIDQEQERNRELSERVIAEAAKAQSLAARLTELEKDED
jgi:chromosome segregation ATPase